MILLPKTRKRAGKGGKIMSWFKRTVVIDKHKSERYNH